MSPSKIDDLKRDLDQLTDPQGQKGVVPANTTAEEKPSIRAKYRGLVGLM